MGKPVTTRRLIVLVAFAIFAPLEIYAQQARSFEQLQLLVKPGDRVSVTDTSGRSTRGNIAELSESTMRLQVNGVMQTFLETDVLEVKRRGDPLGNGAKNGALVGAGFGALCVVAVFSFDGGADAVATSALLVGTTVGLGAAAGVGIDALIRRERTIYRPGSRSTSFMIRPLISAERKGIAVSFSF
jgi:hypothetical protein